MKVALASTACTNQLRGGIFLPKMEPFVPGVSPALLKNKNAECRQRKCEYKPKATIHEVRESAAYRAKGEEDQTRALLYETSLMTASTPRQDSLWVLVQF